MAQVEKLRLATDSLTIDLFDTSIWPLLYSAPRSLRRPREPSKLIEFLRLSFSLGA